MKPFFHLYHMCRVFLIISIASLSIFTAVATILLSPPSPAHAQAYSCPSGQHPDTGNPDGCRPDGYCNTNEVMTGYQNGQPQCILESANTNKCNPNITWQNPDDASECLPASQHCGTASYDSGQGYCVLKYSSGLVYAQNHFANVN